MTVARALTCHAVRAPADAVLVLAAAEEHMDRLVVRLQALHQSRELLVAFDVMLVHHVAAVTTVEAT